MRIKNEIANINPNPNPQANILMNNILGLSIKSIYVYCSS